MADKQEDGVRENSGVTRLSESASGLVVAEVPEATAVPDPERALEMQVVLIEPGWGNTRDNNYYPREMLARDAAKFIGAKMYTCEHEDREKNVRTEVSKVQSIVGFTASGAPVAKVAVWDGAFARRLRNMASLGELGSLACSIYAEGKTAPYEKDGRRGKMVEAITHCDSVDWVTRAGAGGRALALAESAKGEETMADQEEQKGGAPVEDVKQEVPVPDVPGPEMPEPEVPVPGAVPEVPEVPEPDETEPEVPEIPVAPMVPEVEEVEEEKPEQAVGLSADLVKAELGKRGLANVVAERLAERAYATQEELATAINREVEYLKLATGSGKVTGLGARDYSGVRESAPVPVKTREERLDEIDRRYGLRQ